MDEAVLKKESDVAKIASFTGDYLKSEFPIKDYPRARRGDGGHRGIV